MPSTFLTSMENVAMPCVTTRFFFTIFFIMFSFVLLPSASHIVHAQNPMITPPVPEPEHDFGDNDPNVYLCMGDSITRGYGLENYAETYPARLQVLLEKTVINEGQDGARSGYGVSMINRFLARYKPGYVLIMFGANDILERPTDEIADNLFFMVEQARAQKTIPILATVTPVSGSRIGRQSRIDNLNNTLRVRASEQEVLLADVAAVFDPKDAYLLVDGLHPNSAGAELIANTYYEKILESQKKDDAGGGGGCALHSSGQGSFDWLLVIVGIAVIFFFGRRYRQHL
jgi:lysophospholipase L1-like esterase